MYCRLYGLNVEVLGERVLLLPGRCQDISQPADVQVRISPAGGPVKTEEPWPVFYVSADLDEVGIPEFSASRDRVSRAVRMNYSDGFVFQIDAAGQNIDIQWPEGHDIEELIPAFLGPVMGVALRLRGMVCLHASAVVIDGQAVALIGESGAGKSTTAAAFAKRGHPVMTDDVLALSPQDGSFLVRPAYPWVRLWPDSAAGLFGEADALPRMVVGWDKRILDLTQPGYQFQADALPLAALYFLGPRLETGEQPQAGAMNPTEGLMQLITDSFATNFQDKAGRAAEFTLLGRLVEELPLRTISAPNQLSESNALCEAIVQDFRSQKVNRAESLHVAG